MDFGNLTMMNEFILIGLSVLPKVCYLLFLVLALIYQFTLMGNCTILLAIATEKKMSTPIYYFLANLSLLDIFRPSATVLENLLTEKQSISFVGCALQVYFLVTLSGTEVYLLAVMAYDRYVAICFPLRYTLMTKVHGAQLTAGTWAAGRLNSLLRTIFTFRLSFCKSSRVNQYYCDIPQLVALSCYSTYVAEMFGLVVGGVSGMGTFLITFISCIYIISAILKIQSAEGKPRAFSRCASHLLEVSLFYGTKTFIYIRPSSSQHSPTRDRLISMLYVVINPVLNPMINSLRNTEVKETLRKILCPKTSLHLT